ncbi:MAG: TOBE domain-containing protein [Methylomonas sp.]|jgi:molybdate transport system regulatory protein|uniref:TOBE domain-containing protein n=1 Tax=Methylomonas sp. TaxID=418 RepID=UPI0025F3A6D6|nr:TOBE domain-containing protein [Methylomonas sp.]MCK9605615.1 TOBE domain-containing protein [Methylomonas sp.]
MPQKPTVNPPSQFIEADLRLAGMLDSRMIGLLRAIDLSGSINQAAKQMGLSYKGAWQIIERANNGSPKVLINTMTGGSKGGGTRLTETGRAFLNLFDRLQIQHQQFLAQLNKDLLDDPNIILLLQRLVVKTSARNQLFGHIIDIQIGTVSAEVLVKLKDGEQIVVTTTLASIEEMGLRVGADALLLINSSDITLASDADHNAFLVNNRLPCRVLRVQQDQVNAEVMVLLAGGETLAVLNTPKSVIDMGIEPGQHLWVIFNSNAAILGVKN